MHPVEVREEVRALARGGVNDCEIARRTGLARTTVRDMRAHPGVSSAAPRCPRCWRATPPIVFTPGDYTELLGLYLGDGCIAELPRTQRLRISLDARYPQVIEQARQMLRRCFPMNPVGTVRADAGHTVVLSVYSSHLSCLFPQHGRGVKHERRILLEDWQRNLVEAAPWALLRGLTNSDGCAYINRTGRYRYLSYSFCNVSDDIRDLFASTCALVGVDCGNSGKTVRVYRRESVALFAAFVGLKR